MPAKRCPACGTVHRDSAQACDCGYRFDRVSGLDEVRAMLVRKLRRGWSVCLGGGLAVLATTALLVASPGSLAIAAVEVAGMLLIARGAATVSKTRRQLRAIEPKPLPTARLIE